MKKQEKDGKKLRAGVIAGAALVPVAGGLMKFKNAVKSIYYTNVTERASLPREDEWTGGKTYLRVPYAGTSDSQYLDLYVPDTGGEAPQLFVLVHGGGFVAGDAQSRQARLMYRYFRDRGFACASVHYRLATEAGFPAAVCDVKAAVRFLRAHAGAYGYSAGKVFIWGESAGGYLAMMCALTGDAFCDLPFTGQEETGDVSARVDAVVDHYGLMDERSIPEQWKGLGIPSAVSRVAGLWASKLTKEYESITSYFLRKNVSEMTEAEYRAVFPAGYFERAGETPLDVFILHGDCDVLVPYLQSLDAYDRLKQALGEEHVELRLVPHAGHAADMLYDPTILAEVEAFLRARL